MSQYKSIFKTEKELASLLSEICLFAQCHNDYYFNHPEDCEDLDIEHAMQTTSHLVACFMSQYFDVSVHSDIVLDRLCKKLYSQKKWKKIIKKEINDLKEWN